MNLQKNSLIFYLVNIQTYFPAWFSERMIPTKVVNIGIKYLSFYELVSNRCFTKSFENNTGFTIFVEYNNEDQNSNKK